MSQHFGMAPNYLVATIDEGKVVQRELLAKPSHQGGFHGPPHSPGGGHGGMGAQALHASMAAPIRDCQILVAGGMGRGAHSMLRSVGIEPLLTDITSIDEALEAYIAGTLENRTERMH